MRLFLRLFFISMMLTSVYSVSYSIKPSRTIDPGTIEREYPNVLFKKVKTYDGYNLLLADIKPKAATAKNVAILICYPDSGNIKRWLGYGSVLADMGYHVVMFDYRGFGGSDPFITPRDTLYRDEYLTDANAALTYMVKSYPTCKVGLFGMSMGSIITTQLAAEHKADFVIGDSYIADLNGTVDKIEKLFGRKVEVPGSYWSYNEDFQNVSLPMLVFSGKYDTVCNNAIPLQNSLSELVTYRGGYMEGPQSLNKEYFAMIDKFISKVISSNSDHVPETLFWVLPLFMAIVTAGYLLRKRNRHLNFS